MKQLEPITKKDFFNAFIELKVKKTQMKVYRLLSYACFGGVDGGVILGALSRRLKRDSNFPEFKEIKDEKLFKERIEEGVESWKELQNSFRRETVLSGRKTVVNLATDNKDTFFESVLIQFKETFDVCENCIEKSREIAQTETLIEDTYLKTLQHRCESFGEKLSLIGGYQAIQAEDKRYVDILGTIGTPPEFSLLHNFISAQINFDTDKIVKLCTESRGEVVASCLLILDSQLVKGKMTPEEHEIACLYFAMLTYFMDRDLERASGCHEKILSYERDKSEVLLEKNRLYKCSESEKQLKMYQQYSAMSSFIMGLVCCSVDDFQHAVTHFQTALPHFEDIPELEAAIHYFSAICCFNLSDISQWTHHWVAAWCIYNKLNKENDITKAELIWNAVVNPMCILGDFLAKCEGSEAAFWYYARALDFGMVSFKIFRNFFGNDHEIVLKLNEAIERLVQVIEHNRDFLQNNRSREMKGYQRYETANVK